MVNIRIQAEDMVLENYREFVPLNAANADGSYVRLRRASGTASFTLSQEFERGLYQVILGLYDESDGESSFSVEVGDEVLDPLVANVNLDGGTRPNSGTFTEQNVGDPITIDPNDVIQLTATRNLGERAAFDYIELRPIIGPSTSGIDDVRVNEDAADTSIDLLAAFNDNDPLDFSIENNTNVPLFSSVTIDDQTGQLILDYADVGTGTADITVRATDPDGLFVDTTFNILVNGAPTTTGISDVLAAENGEDRVIDLFAAFDDVEDDDTALTFSVENNTNPSLFTSFDINPETGELTLDYVDSGIGEAEITIRATDTDGLFVETDFTVNVLSDTTPVRIEAENFRTEGGQGVAFNDEDGVVDIGSVEDSSGGSHVTDVETGEWLTYDITIPRTSTYDIVVRAASRSNVDHNLEFSVGGSDLGTVSFRRTGAPTTWQEFTLDNVTLGAGEQVLRVDLNPDVVGDLNERVEIDYIELIPLGTDPGGDNQAPVVAEPIEDIPATEDAADQRIDLTNVFSDPDGDNLTFQVTNNTDNSVVTSTIDGNELILNFAAVGTADITVQASDAEISVTDTFTVNVTGPMPASRGIFANLEQGIQFTPDEDLPETLRIMPLGDSITEGQTEDLPNALREGYRLPLSDALTDLGIDFDFVGSRSNGSSDLTDKDHEGHPSWNINQLQFGDDDDGLTRETSGIDFWVPQFNPDVILLLAGTNNSNGQGSTVGNSRGILMQRFLGNGNNSGSGLYDSVVGFEGKTLVGTLPPVQPDSPNANRQDWIDGFNDYLQDDLIDAAANRQPNTIGKVEVVDIASVVDPVTGMSDPNIDNGLHPSVEGYENMAAVWFDALLDSYGTVNPLTGQDLTGSTGDDVLTGNDNANQIDGGLGNDNLTGAGGADTFVLAAGAGTDTITDFEDGTDLLGLDGITFDDLTLNGNQVLLTATSETLAVVQGVGSLAQDDFTVV
ncbi:MAG: carbohydrate-binding protein [Microcoleaceae cyanobacterium]